ncbi:MAG: PTS sugar transporter subunit IIA [Spirochaetaceae bacterium]|nr:PTS sugar transporter subunit IIA [Spirochaetaceae bacterium]
MALFELIDKKTVKIPLKSKKKNDCIKELIGILKDAGKLKDTKTALADVLKREELASTGLGEGIAIPHAKTTVVDNLTIAVGLAPKGIDFDSLDDIPSTIFFLLLAPPDQVGPHLQALTEISKLTRNKEFCNSLLHAANSAEVVELFKKESLKQVL